MHIAVFDKELKLKKIALSNREHIDRVKDGNRVYFGKDYATCDEADLADRVLSWTGVFDMDTGKLIGVIEEEIKKNDGKIRRP